MFFGNSQERHRRHRSTAQPYAEDVIKNAAQSVGPDNFHYEISVEAARKQGELELKIGTSAIRNEYQKRLQDVGTLRAKAQQALQNLELERTSMLRTREELLMVMKDFESTLNVNIQWVKLRKGQESYTSSAAMKDLHRNIEQSLEHSAKDVKQALLGVVDHLQKIALAIKETDAAIEKLKADIVVKSGNMLMDKACMEGLVTSGMMFPASQSSPRSPRGVASSAASTNHQQQHRGHEQDWMSKGQTATIHGLHTIERCTPIRKAAQEYLVEIRESGRIQRNPEVLEALRNQAKYGDQLDLQLQMNTKSLQNQIITIDRQRAALQVSLDKVREQLNVAKQRLQMSSVRPEVDGAPSNVEEMLSLEINKLMRNEAELCTKLHGLIRNQTTTEKMLNALEQQATQNRKTTETAKACMDVKLPPISSPRRGGSVAQLGGSSTPRSGRF